MASLKPCDGTINRATHPSLRKHFLYCLVRTAMQLKGELHEALTPLALSAPEFLILEALEAAGPSSQNALGRQMGVDQASMVRFVDNLEAQGYLERLSDKADKRTRLLSPTGSGKKALAKALRLMEKVEKDFFGAVPRAQRAALHATLQSLLESRDPSTPTAPRQMKKNSPRVGAQSLDQ